jgi:hypothetical protein
MKSDEYNALRRQMDALVADQAAHFIVLSALIPTHPRHEDLQMAITNAVELLLPSMPPAAMTDEMKERTRATVENLQRLHPADPGAPGVKARLVISKTGSALGPGRSGRQ